MKAAHEHAFNNEAIRGFEFSYQYYTLQRRRWIADQGFLHHWFRSDRPELFLQLRFTILFRNARLCTYCPINTKRFRTNVAPIHNNEPSFPREQIT